MDTKTEANSAYLFYGGTKRSINFRASGILLVCFMDFKRSEV